MVIKFQSFLSGSSGNCTFITDDETYLLVDSGAGGKYITECMQRLGIHPAALSGILLTHEHRDHIAGAGVLSRRFNLPVYATSKTWEAIGDSLGSFAPENKRITEPDMRFGAMTVHAFSIPHDATDPVAYSFTCDGDKFTIATDMGEVTDTVLENIEGSHAVIIEANHDITMLQNGRYPYPLKKRILGRYGHLSNEACGRLCVRLAQSGTCAFWLGHLSAENNKPPLAYDTVASILQDASLSVGGGLALNVLPRYWIH